MICVYAEIFCWKNVSSFCIAKATHIFSAKNIIILYIESAKTVNEMTLNELVKLTTLWTTGPWKIIVVGISPVLYGLSGLSNLVYECIIISHSINRSLWPVCWLLTCINPCHAEWIQMTCPLLIVSQSDFLIQVVDTNLHNEWQTVQIQISRLLQIWIYTVYKGWAYPGLAGPGLKAKSYLGYISCTLWPDNCKLTHQI